MKGSEIGSAAFREPPSGGPRKAQPEVCLESRSPQQSLGLRGKSLIFRLKVTRVRRAYWSSWSLDADPSSLSASHRRGVKRLGKVLCSRLMINAA